MAKFKRSLRQKKFVKKYTARKTRKGVKTRATKEMITYMAPQQMPFPPRYRCKLQCDLYGHIASGSASGLYNVTLNNLITPYNTSNILPNPSLTVSTLSPTGYATICNNYFYTRFRVYSSKISFQVIPQSLADTIEVCITPAQNQGYPTNTPTALAQPFSKSTMFQANQNRGPLINYITQHKLIGCTQRALQDDLSNSYAGEFNAAPGNTSWWTINWATVDAVNLSTALNYVCKMEYYVEFWGMDFADIAE